jgi:hypothetical protein
LLIGVQAVPPGARRFVLRGGAARLGRVLGGALRAQREFAQRAAQRRLRSRRSRVLAGREIPLLAERWRERGQRQREDLVGQPGQCRGAERIARGRGPWDSVGLRRPGGG